MYIYIFIYINIHTLHATHLYAQSHFTYIQTHTQFAPDYLCQPFFIFSPHSPQHHGEYVKKVLSNKRKKKLW